MPTTSMNLHRWFIWEQQNHHHHQTTTVTAPMANEPPPLVHLGATESPPSPGLNHISTLFPTNTGSCLKTTTVTAPMA
ncbi:hypothetical protein L1987_44865 [Smallanthus sonchifolius]|uniref:Uncharacterized protein n=1 Tax=Smallanthus sonchifolius TaxID=185202 RepID=A0ACB9GRM7_9ASTR|nr:hypothetical protein L1987_44865 [Smallanthus sonchifolius]